jgi:predicted GIY-YIG superfamily endonuclease
VSAYFYILRCSDGSYYAGTTRDSLEARIGQHQTGVFDGYTARRRPVTLVFHQEFQEVEDAIAAERQVKGWRRDKKEALIRQDFALLPALARRGMRTVTEKEPVRPSRRRFAPPQDEGKLVMALRKTSS